IIYPGVIMTVDIKIGNHVIVSPKCGIGHNSKVDDYVSLLWNVNVSGYDTIGEGSLIGSGVTIIQNKIIGKDSIIGAGAVVIDDFGDKVKAVGIPAIIKK
ncbi:MAG: transferase, partial [Clostridium paraputrificum]